MREQIHTKEGALTANKNNIVAVLSPNDGLAGGAIQALTAQGLAGKVPVSGGDAGLDGGVLAANDLEVRARASDAVQVAAGAEVGTVAAQHHRTHAGVGVGDIERFAVFS